jgi:hypothetical protein
MKIFIIYIIFMTSLLILLNPTHSDAQQNITSSTKPPSINVKQILQSLIPLIEVEYQSESFVVLKGEEGILLQTNGTMTLFWNAIDIVKGYGYSLNEVTTSGAGSQGNPTRFYALMTKP